MRKTRLEQVLGKYFKEQNFSKEKKEEYLRVFKAYYKLIESIAEKVEKEEIFIENLGTIKPVLPKLRDLFEDPEKGEKAKILYVKRFNKNEEDLKRRLKHLFDKSKTNLYRI